MIYKDRIEAALLLTKKLKKYRGMNGVVVAIPRGGLPGGYVLAKYLDFPLDIALTKKIGYPTNKEYAIGSVSLQGRIVGNEAVAEEYIEAETKRLRKALREKYQLYRGDRSPVNLTNKIVIITDDGIATGHTILATIGLVKVQLPKKVIIAVPVAPAETIEWIKEKVDEIICLQTPLDFNAVGQFFQDFESVSDSQAIAILKKAQRNEKAELENKNKEPW